MDDCTRVARLRKEATNASSTFYHLMLLGDSGGGRDVYCQLYALLLHGTEKQPADNDYGDPDVVGCGGLFPIAMRGNVSYDTNGGLPNDFNATHYLRSSASVHQGGRVFHFDVPAAGGGSMRVSWSYVYGFTDPGKGIATVQTIVKVLQSLRHAGTRLPDDVVLGAGVADYDLLARAPPTLQTLDSFAAVGLARAAGATTVLRAWGDFVNGKGGKKVKAQSRLWFRSNHCNTRFGAAAADQYVVPLFHGAGHGLLEIFNFSIGYPDMAFDGFHVDRQPWKRPASFAHGAGQHVGELTAQASASMLYNLCRDGGGA